MAWLMGALPVHCDSLMRHAAVTVWRWCCWWRYTVTLLHYSKTSTVYPLNREYISNWPPWHIRHCTLASHLTCPNCYNIMKPHGLRDLPLLFNSVPRYNLEFGLRAFQISAPKIWNLLPASIRNSPSLPTFRRHLKTHYFQSTNPNP